MVCVTGVWSATTTAGMIRVWQCWPMLSHQWCSRCGRRDLAPDSGILADPIKFQLSDPYDKLTAKSRARAIIFPYGPRLPPEWQVSMGRNQTVARNIVA
jgi:hypothetical protein